MDAAPFITVVSGLPRSGTSLMMQMLRAGGLPLLCDDARSPDESNPRGYFEYEAVKRTAQDASWVPQARGKAVKVIHALLRALPAGERYRVLVMRRPLDEVMASQQRMLARAGAPAASLSPERLGQLFERQLADVEEWIERQPGFALLRVDYGELVAEPSRLSTDIQRFLGARLDTSAMTAEVDPTLHRERRHRAPASAAHGRSAPRIG